jgi:hypothetical protein
VPVTYKIDAEKKTIRTKCVGHVKLHEVIDHFKALAKDPECPQFLNVFLDLRETDSLPSPNHISVVVNQLGKVRSRIQFGACAIVTSRDALFGTMRMFEARAEEFFAVTRTFRTAAEAEEWLAIQQSGI